MTKRSRKARHNPYKQKHDTLESIHPYAAKKLSNRRAMGICEGCGHDPCTCKSCHNPLHACPDGTPVPHEIGSSCMSTEEKKKKIKEVEAILENMWGAYNANPEEIFCSLGNLRSSMRMSFVCDDFIEETKALPDDTLIRISKGKVEVWKEAK